MKRKIADLCLNITGNYPFCSYEILVGFHIFELFKDDNRLRTSKINFTS